MTANSEPNGDRTAFRAHAIAFWAESRSGTAERANAHTDASDAIAQRWAEAGNAREILTSMLHDELPEVRFAAASYLLKIHDDAAAIPVLEELARTGTSAGMIASGAKLLLMKHRSDHPQQ